MPEPTAEFKRKPPTVELPEDETLCGYLSVRDDGALVVSFSPAFIQSLTAEQVEEVGDCIRHYLLTKRAGG